MTVTGFVRKAYFEKRILFIDKWRDRIQDERLLDAELYFCVIPMVLSEIFEQEILKI